MHSIRNIQIKTKQNVSAENEEQPQKKNNKKTRQKTNTFVIECDVNMQWLCMLDDRR